jgi:hypothetical protein
MFITSSIGWAKSLFESFSKPQTYGSALESYIVSNNPQSADDVDRLSREFELRQSQFIWGRGL